MGYQAEDQGQPFGKAARIVPDEASVGCIRRTEVGRRDREDVVDLRFLVEIQLEPRVEHPGKPGEFLFEIAGVLLDQKGHGCC